MHVELSFLCDAATESGGKLNALGIGVDRLFVTELPARHGRLDVVARIAFDPEDEGNHPLAIALIGPDGAPVTPPSQLQLAVQFADAARPTNVNVIVQLANLQFTLAGPHEAKLSLDGAEVAVLPLEVTVRQPGSPGVPGVG